MSMTEQEMVRKVTGRAMILDGKKVAGQIRSALSDSVKARVNSGQRPPGLAVILVGNNQGSEVYVKNKVLASEKVGIKGLVRRFGESASADEVVSEIESLNQAADIDGILVQLPLPGHISAQAIVGCVAADKDVDGLTPVNLGRLLAGIPGLRPCTPSGVIALLERYGVEIAGKQAVVVGRSNLVGKPVALMLMERNATVTICHSRSKNLADLCLTADILVAAAGRQEMIRGSWIKEGAVVVDVGIHRSALPDGSFRLSGDVDFQEAVARASLITPVPGGVGPMTVAMLLANTIEAYQAHIM